MWSYRVKRYVLKFIVAAFFCSILTSCWDQVEINQLAIVNMAGVDRNPKNGNFEVYYQVINPSGMSGQTGASIKAPVYVYKVEGKHVGVTANKSNISIPRELFADHYQIIIISKKLAQEGMREYLNFTEQQPDRRTTVHMVIADSPIPDIMNTFTPLERLPGRSLKSSINNASKFTGKISEFSRVKDVLKQMESSKLTLLPIIKLSTSKQESTSSRFEQIDADKGNIRFDGAALIKHGRMIGEINSKQAIWYNLLNNQLHSFIQDVEFPDKQVLEVQVDGSPKVSNKLMFASGHPSLRVNIRLKLKIISNTLNELLTEDKINEIEDRLNQKVYEQATTFLEYSQSKDWDVLSIEEQLKKKRGSSWNQFQNDPEYWKKVNIALKIQSKVTTTGTSIHPYKGD